MTAAALGMITKKFKIFFIVFEKQRPVGGCDHSSHNVTSAEADRDIFSIYFNLLF
jgi:hypothetical protein